MHTSVRLEELQVQRDEEKDPHKRELIENIILIFESKEKRNEENKSGRY